MRKLVAWIYLALAFWKHVVLLRPWRHRYGLAQFRENYAPDHLRPLTPDERRLQPRHARCIDCGLCVAAYGGLGESASGSGAGATAGGPSLPLLPLRWARAGHDAWAVEEADLRSLVGSEALAAAEAACPTSVPLGDVGRFILRARETARVAARAPVTT